VVGIELYDYTIDADEDLNLADRPHFAAIKDKLRRELRAGWRKALPPEEELQSAPPQVQSQEYRVEISA